MSDSDHIHINISLVPFLSFAPRTDIDNEDSQKKSQDEKANELQVEDGIKVKSKKQKKSNSLVRRLSLNKFRTTPEQEPRHTPEGGDSSRSLSQSSQDSTSRLDNSPTTISRKGSDEEKSSTLSLPTAKERPDKPTKKEGKKKEEQTSQQEQLHQQKSELTEKPVSTVTVVQRKSPSLTIRSINLQEEHAAKLQQNGERTQYP